MEKATPDNLGSRVRKALRDENVPPWLPGITAELADAAWRKLGRDLRLTQASYGTARMVRRSLGALRWIEASIASTSAGGMGRDVISVELLPEDVARCCSGPEVRFLGAQKIVTDGVLRRVEEALEILGSVPTLLPTVCMLVRALHLIEPANDEVDVSFSDPGLPFSAFVSVPGPNAVAGSLRVGEALLHEAMHLQLSLAEAVLPLVAPTERTYFSPWRNEHRTAQGVLHALYVFRVIDSFLGAIPLEGPKLAFARRYVGERRATIARQVRQIRNFRGCSDLTADGAAFVDRLLR